VNSGTLALCRLQTDSLQASATSADFRFVRWCSIFAEFSQPQPRWSLTQPLPLIGGILHTSSAGSWGYCPFRVHEERRHAFESRKSPRLGRSPLLEPCGKSLN